MADDETFLGRWSRRKAEARREPEGAPAGDAQGPAVAAPGHDLRDTPPDEETKQRWIAELEKVDIDKLSYEDDFSTFMKSWVPEALRRKALRKLWTTSPALALPDGLDDYCEDYTDAATAVSNLASSWLPGKGYSRVQELAEKVEDLTGEAELAPSHREAEPQTDDDDRRAAIEGESEDDAVAEDSGDRFPAEPDEPEKS